MNDEEFSKHERLIIITLYRNHRPMSISEIARDAAMSWTTVKKYVDILQKKNIVKVTAETEGSFNKVMFDFELYARSLQALEAAQ